MSSYLNIYVLVNFKNKKVKVNFFKFKLIVQFLAKSVEKVINVTG